VARGNSDEFRIDIDVEYAQREAERVRDMLAALRRRHDLARYEYTSLVRIAPGSKTFAHPVLTLGNRFADTEDMLLSTYLHEQMHWYLWLLGTPDRDMVAPFYDELVRRYPRAPIAVPEGAHGYDATYSHLVVNWLEVAATSEFIGRERALAVAAAATSYRWIYRAVVEDWDELGELYTRHGIVPIQPASKVKRDNARAARSAVSGAPRKTPAGERPRASPRSRHTPRGRGGRRSG
jgi:hypothetical protein